LEECFLKYQDALNWIHGLSRFGSNPGLDRIRELLRMLGDPQDRLRCVHIAGTNGKGSTAAFLASMLTAEGCRVGLYTSPYLEAFTNRMAIGGIDIDELSLAALVERVKPLVEEIALTKFGQATEFEVVTAMAFTYFAQCQPDWVVVEVGLGGRLDATNVIIPAVSVITNIGLDHTQVLGDTVGAIAWEKAGIIKGGIPVITAAEKPEALAVITQVAAERGASLHTVDADIRYTIQASTLDGQIFDYMSSRHTYPGMKIRLLGEHQVRNAVTALAARELLDETVIDESAVRSGLAEAQWPGRLEVFSRSPLVLVDGAHNSDGFQALRTALLSLLAGKKLHLVLGILGDKAVDEILSLAAPLATAGMIITRPDNIRAADPYAVAQIASRYTSAPVVVEENIADAVKRALYETRVDEALCVCGSLYTISEAREILKERMGK
jgi:dihydrofolate synthase/folylpolyglutamate synthase